MNESNNRDVLSNLVFLNSLKMNQEIDSSPYHNNIKQQKSLSSEQNSHRSMDVCPDTISTRCKLPRRSIFRQKSSSSERNSHQVIDDRPAHYEQFNRSISSNSVAYNSWSQDCTTNKRSRQRNNRKLNTGLKGSTVEPIDYDMNSIIDLSSIDFSIEVFSDDEIAQMRTHSSTHLKNRRWIVDSGASTHMCHDLSLFQQFVSSKLGMIRIVFVPDLDTNLISVKKLVGDKVSFEGVSCFLHTFDRNILLGKVIKSAYELNENHPAKNNNQLATLCVHEA